MSRGSFLGEALHTGDHCCQNGGAAGFGSSSAKDGREVLCSLPRHSSEVERRCESREEHVGEGDVVGHRFMEDGSQESREEERAMSG